MLALGIRYRKEREKKEKERLHARRQLMLAARMLLPDLPTTTEDGKLNPDIRNLLTEALQQQGQSQGVRAKSASPQTLGRSKSEHAAHRAKQTASERRRKSTKTGTPSGTVTRGDSTKQQRAAQNCIVEEDQPCTSTAAALATPSRKVTTPSRSIMRKAKDFFAGKRSKSCDSTLDK